MPDTFDVAVIGGGHNGLTAAAYLARAGKRVIVAERLATLGGAASSALVFQGVDAQLSPYAHLVHVLPERIVDDLGLGIRYAHRRHRSYSPLPGTDRGLLIDADDPAETTAGFASIGALADAAAWRDFTADTSHLSHRLAPTLCEPMPTRRDARGLVGDDRVWNAFIEQPIGRHIERTFEHDLVRGLAGAPALTGTFAPNIDPSLDGNRSLLHLALGEGAGGAVPVGGMGSISGELARVALLAGASLATNTEVVAVTPEGEVRLRSGDRERVIGARWVLADVAPHVLEQLLLAGMQPTRPGRRAAEVPPPPARSASDATPASAPTSPSASISDSDSAPASPAPEGSQIKANLVLTRLPRLRGDIDATAAFGGTFHANQGWRQRQSAFESAASGVLSDRIPAEASCHSLADPSILGPELRASGAQTLTVVAAHAPHRLGLHREQAQAAVLASLDSVLAEPLEPLLLSDAEGRPCIETKTTADLERELRMPGGHVFHGPLDWPFLDDDAPRRSPAQRWGVATAHARVLLCGAGARRGGSVSGIGGHNAAMAVLEADPVS